MEGIVVNRSYSNEQLYDIAGDNYGILYDYCTVLLNEGYWDDVQKILKMDPYEILVLYVQSLLVCFAVYCNSLTEEERRFIASFSNKKDRAAMMEIDEKKLVKNAEHFQNNPPILFQLLSLRDYENGSGMTGLFFDAILNIMLCMSYLDGKRNAVATRYMGVYFDKVGAFLQNNQNPHQAVDSKYIFKKLCYDELSNSADHIKNAKYDFERYKKAHLYYKEAQMESVQSAHISDSDVHVGVENAQVGQALDRAPIETNDKPQENVDTVDTRNNANAVINSEQPSCESPDDTPEILEKMSEERLKEYVNELESLVGLADVKREIRSLINLIKVKKMREKYCLPEIDMSYHMVFTGGPGTGKTTVARLVGKIYKELGILSKGTMIETDRAGLVAGYVGQTALKVKEVVDKAKGGILFIDEAYSLANGGVNDFGSEAIDTLVKLMEDHRDDLVVIVAGYTQEMNRFLESNTGLISRFNKFINFYDYSSDELVLILRGMASKSGYDLEEGLEDDLKVFLSEMSSERTASFGNARGIRNIFEKLVGVQADRIVTLEEVTPESLRLIKREDFHVIMEAL